MDQEKFVELVKRFPQVWNRTHPDFREQGKKEKSWMEIGNLCGTTAQACKDMFKALREKYLREREKAKQTDSSWYLLDSMSFLEPHIVTRKQSMNVDEDMRTAEELSVSFNSDYSNIQANSQEFESNLIRLVKKSTPIWNRNCETFTSKQFKMELWCKIAEKLNKNPHYCMLRWKSLREKYIRQKNKLASGEEKWHFLDELSFLDEVIQYRRKNQASSDFTFSNFTENHPDFLPAGDSSKHNQLNDAHNSESFDRFTFDTDCSSNDFIIAVKQENCDEIPDSSNDLKQTTSVRKRNHNESDEGEPPSKCEYREQQSPEQLFGNLVAVMLAKKTERDKNIAMMEIMKILTN